MKDRVPYEACPLCASRAIGRLIEADCSGHELYDPRLSPTIVWFACGDCGHIFTEGYFTEAALGILFSRTNAGQKLGADLEKLRPIAARMVNRVLPYVNEGVWLDVGVGNGALLFTAQEYGFEVIGTDLRSANVRHLASVGIEAHKADITDLSLSGSCSVISMADVLEHMPFPTKGLGAANRLMDEGGVLLISMPNADSMVWKLLDRARANPYWGEIEHYHNFGRKRLYALLEETGFEPVSYGVSERYRACMEVLARKVRGLSDSGG